MNGWRGEPCGVQAAEFKRDELKHKVNEERVATAGFEPTAKGL